MVPGIGRHDALARVVHQLDAAEASTGRVAVRSALYQQAEDREPGFLRESGERYRQTYFDASWAQNRFGDISAAQARLDAQLASDSGPQDAPTDPTRE